jgi:hypothetical protein
MRKSTTETGLSYPEYVFVAMKVKTVLPRIDI